MILFLKIFLQKHLEASNSSFIHVEIVFLLRRTFGRLLYCSFFFQLYEWYYIFRTEVTLESFFFAEILKKTMKFRTNFARLEKENLIVRITNFALDSQCTALFLLLGSISSFFMCSICMSYKSFRNPSLNVAKFEKEISDRNQSCS